MVTDAVFKTFKNKKANVKFSWWQCMNVVLVMELQTIHILCKLQCKLCKQLFGHLNFLMLASKLYLKSTAHLIEK